MQSKLTDVLTKRKTLGGNQQLKLKNELIQMNKLIFENEISDFISGLYKAIECNIQDEVPELVNKDIQTIL